MHRLPYHLVQEDELELVRVTHERCDCTPSVTIMTNFLGVVAVFPSPLVPASEAMAVKDVSNAVPSTEVDVVLDSAVKAVVVVKVGARICVAVVFRK